MSTRREFVREHKHIELLLTENNDLRQRLKLMAELIEELMKVHEKR